MRTTYCDAKMQFIDVSALEDSAPSSNGNKSFADIQLLKDNITPLNYGTLELNQFVLDGSKAILPNDGVDDISFMSENISGKDCYFTNNPVVTIAFTENHTSSGITLTFADDYPSLIKITWYTLYGTKIISKEFAPDSLIYVCKKQVSNYGKIDIEFVKTRLPYRYARLQYVLYGVQIEWKASDITKASLIEEIDVTSATLAINTAKLSIIDMNNDFDISNKNGAWKSVQKAQEIELSEYINGDVVPCGTFYLSENSFSGNIANFSLVDAIGLMDNYTFCDGEIYSNVKAGIILESIFAAAKIKKYEIVEDIYNIPLTGTLAIQTCREALQMVCFACGAVADDSRSDTIKVYRPDRYVSNIITIDRKFSAAIKQGEYVSGVSIEYNKYTLSEQPDNIYDDILPSGDTRIELSSPYSPSSIVASAGTLLEAKTNYIVIHMEESEQCTISGHKYEENTFSYAKQVDYLDAGETENVKTFGTCTLFNSDKIKENAEYLLNYYSLRKNVSMKFILDDEHVGNWVNIYSRTGTVSTTLITSQSIDLSGGFLSAATCVGYSTVVTDYLFAGTELYSGGDVII